MKVYCLGIGGAGLSGLARLLHAQGNNVSGSDATLNATVQDLQHEGLTVFVPHDAVHVPLDADLYVYSDAVPETNPERALLMAQGKTLLSYFEALGQFMQVFPHRVAVSGTHGKTTTTAMLTLVLQAAGIDPTAVVGSTVTALGSNVRVGHSDYCVVEACEHKAHMLKLHPTDIVLTNIEEDHLDFYRDLQHIQETFQQYISGLPANGLLVRNSDDLATQVLLYAGPTITFGIHNTAQIMAHDIQKTHHEQTFWVGTDQYTIQVPGDYNIYNALAVIAYCTANKIPVVAIQAGLKQFTGTARRFEVMGQYHGADIILDYAHHPTAIKNVLQATKEFYPDKRLVIVFQPHQHNRTKKLFDQFVPAFAKADLIILQEIFDVLGREEQADQTVSSQDLVNAIIKTGKAAVYSLNQVSTKKLLDENVTSHDVVLIVGAGDVYLLSQELCSKV